MALAKCEDCGREVSTEAAACPNCGRPMSAAATTPTSTAAQPSQPDTGAPPPKTKKNWFARHPILTVILAVIVIGIIAAAASGGNKKHGSGVHRLREQRAGGKEDAHHRARVETGQAETEPEGTTAAGRPGRPELPVNGRGLLSRWPDPTVVVVGRFGLPPDRCRVRGQSPQRELEPQAVQAAKNYKATGGGSPCSGMIQQLSSSAGSGFTHAQAVYGAKRSGVC